MKVRECVNIWVLKYAHAVHHIVSVQNIIAFCKYSNNQPLHFWGRTRTFPVLQQNIFEIYFVHKLQNSAYNTYQEAGPNASPWNL